jgi:hypothetical protein
LELSSDAGIAATSLREVAAGSDEGKAYRGFSDAGSDQSPAGTPRGESTNRAPAVPIFGLSTLTPSKGPPWKGNNDR